MNEEFYNRHYIAIRPDSAIIDAWSDGPHPEKDTTGAVCINDKGGYQFSMIVSVGFPENENELFQSDLPALRRTEENPPLYTIDGIPMYKWGDGMVIRRTEEEIAADRAAIPAPPPSAQEQLRADVDFIAAMTGVSL